MDKDDVIKSLPEQINTEMVTLKNAKGKNIFVQGKILAYTNVTRMLLDMCVSDYADDSPKEE